MEIFGVLTAIVPSAALAVAVVLVLFAARRILDRGRSRARERQFRDQILMLGLTLTGLLVIVLSLPISDATRAQLLSLLGVLVSAMIALASTTFVGNAMAGLMLRSLRHFRAGDFVKVGDHFGRVSERGLFHVEIQTEDRDLTTLPNLYVVTNPVTVVHGKGTIVSAAVSLGYDVPREAVEERLLKAAAGAKLEEPFVHVMELGDFSVSYRVAGLLPEVKTLLSARSHLREMILDELHDGGIEIVSPSFMNQRALGKDARFVPPVRTPLTRTVDKKPPEAVVFDKADEAETLARMREHVAALEKAIAKKKKESEDGASDPGVTKRLTAELERLEQRRERVLAVLDELAGGGE